MPLTALIAEFRRLARQPGPGLGRLDLWVFPIVLGVGEKVFDGDVVPANLVLLEPPVASSKGAVLLRYGRGAGTPGTGDIGREDRNVGASRAKSVIGEGPRRDLSLIESWSWG